jgi:glutaminyl-peptide cyclotransferase
MTFPIDDLYLGGGKQILDGMPGTVETTTIPRWRAQVLAVHPHDIWAFCEGLVLHGGQLYESTGPEGFSSLRRVHLRTGLVLQAMRFDRPDFCEGIALRDNQIVQLTFRQQRARIHALPSFERVGEFSYEGEGWGLAFDGRRFVMSDGGSDLTLRDPATFEVLSTKRVSVEGRPQPRLNELECVGDLVYANVFGTNCVLEIGPDGVVRKVIDLTGLLSAHEQGCLGLGDEVYRRAAVLNGIAYDRANDTFLITGKLWPKVFRVRFVP